MNEVKGKILIVDDDPSALRLVQYSLQIEGYETITAQSGSEALAAIEKDHPSLIVLDVMMPDMSGIEVCRRLRSSPETSHLPILMLSAKGKVEDRVTGLKAGADDYVPKPVDPSELLARVEAIILRAARSTPATASWARFIAFLGAKGGVGTTTVAVNVALAAVRQGKSVILVDLHPYLGTVCPMLGLDPPHNISELITIEPRRIKPRDIDGRLVSHFTGLQVLGSSQTPLENGDTLSLPHVGAILDGLSTMADYVVFDLAVHVTPTSQAVLDRCDFVTLVTEPDPIALHSAKGRLTLLKQWGIMGELVGVTVVNHSSSAMTTTIREIGDMLGTSIVGAIPPARDASLHALRHGKPIILTQPTHLASKLLEELAFRLTGELTAATQ